MNSLHVDDQDNDTCICIVINQNAELDMIAH
jgi:hypothetical protein